MKLKKSISNIEFDKMLFICYILFVTFYIVGSQNWIGNRIYDYFYFSLPMVIPLFLKRIFQKNKFDSIAITIALIVLLFYFSYRSYQGDLAGVYPYEFYWEGL